jgi:hypothetical protein
MLIPAWHVALMWSLYALAYGLRAWYRKQARYRYVGKTVGRLLVAGVYWWLAFMPMDAEVRAIWVRWSVFIFPIIDLIFMAQEHFEGRMKHAKPT